MLRRLALTAAVSAAALGAAAPAPAAVADPLPLPLPVLGLTGDAPGSARTAPDELTVVVSRTGYARTDGRYRLECDPVGGTHPAARSACARLDEIARSGRDPFAPVPRGRMCTQQYGGSATARITGTWQGRPVDASFDRSNGCEISRWRSLEPVLPNTGP
ncbi:subtilase-type protease inhibitor [Streptomyces sp. C10-9-1]|uniref:SSI family serine proteinase inhibitor n=1 Tax=Streptomyces sp. C10-9-1 TaxID=1859285 RepID=UPI0021123F9D|nr:SSI family serine proteinase inhibitor [Streptomyces sp. C10-9-1]MCQ6555979.1 subtilase-type protease inhibitor [Streptomyces sp. C10-9-1]